MEKLIESTLVSKDIVIRQDGDSSTYLEENAGVYYPLILVSNTVINFQNILSFELSIGDSFLPQLNFTIDDEEYHFRQEDFSDGIDLVTIYIGNSKDTIYKSIKNDYLIKSVTSVPGGKYINFSCELHVPLLYSGTKRCINNTSFEAIKLICSEVGLGFCSNINGTDDSMKWLQIDSNMEFLQHLGCKIKTQDNSYCLLFVDQYGNLNLIDTKVALKSNPNTQLEINLESGEPLETPINIKLSSNREDPNLPFKVLYYTPVNSYGEKALKYNTVLNQVKLDNNDYVNEIEISTELNNQLSSISTFSYIDSLNTFDSFGSMESNKIHGMQLLQGLKIDLVLNLYVPPIYVGMSVDTEIYNFSNRQIKKSSDINKTIDEVYNESTEFEGYTNSLNTKLSGEFLVLGIKISYNKDNKAKKPIQESLKIFKKV